MTVMVWLVAVAVWVTVLEEATTTVKVVGLGTTVTYVLGAVTVRVVELGQTVVEVDTRVVVTVRPVVVTGTPGV